MAMDAQKMEDEAINLIDAIIQIDISLFYFINNSLQNIIFDIVMPFITELKNWFPVIFIFLAAILIKDYKNALALLVLILVTVIISDFTAHRVLKPLFGRMRPCKTLEGVRLLVGCSGSYSLPSNHATNIFAVATVISHKYRSLVFVMFAIACLIAFSRVYIGVHYPLDILLGAVTGTSCGISLILFKNLILTKRDEQLK